MTSHELLLYRISSIKNEQFCHHLLSLMLLQTCDFCGNTEKKDQLLSLFFIINYAFSKNYGSNFGFVRILNTF